MFKGLHHIAFNVKNMEISSEFYKKLGFELVGNYDSETKKLKHLLGYGLKLELSCKPADKDLSSEGAIKHIALKVEDIEKACCEFRKLGISIKKEIKTAVSLPAKYCFIEDPDGILIEILEDL